MAIHGNLQGIAFLARGNTGPGHSPRTVQVSQEFLVGVSSPHAHYLNIPQFQHFSLNSLPS